MQTILTRTRTASTITGALSIAPWCANSTDSWKGSAFEANYLSILCAANGDLKSIRVELTAAPGSGCTVTFVLRRKTSGGSWADTAATFTISGASDTVGSWSGTLSLADTDELSFQRTANIAAADAEMLIAYEFDPTNPSDSMYGTGAWDDTSAGDRAGTLSTSPGSSGFGNNNGPSAMALAGDWLKLRCSISATQGSDITFALEKNGVLQDGSGGTVDTRCVVAAGQLQGVANFTLSVVTGDRVGILRGAGGGTLGTRTGLLFRATIPGQYMIAGGTEVDFPSNSVTQYSAPTGTPVSGWTATEADAQGAAGLSGMTALGMTVFCAAAPGAGRSFTATLRKASAGTSMVVVVADTDQTESVVSTVTFAAGERVGLETVPAGAPASSGTRWTLGLGSLPPNTGALAVTLDPVTSSATSSIEPNLGHFDGGLAHAYVFDQILSAAAVRRHYRARLLGNLGDEYTIQKVTISQFEAGEGKKFPVRSVEAGNSREADMPDLFTKE